MSWYTYSELSITRSFSVAVSKKKPPLTSTFQLFLLIMQFTWQYYLLNKNILFFYSATCHGSTSRSHPNPCNVSVLSQPSSYAHGV